MVFNRTGQNGVAAARICPSGCSANRVSLRRESIARQSIIEREKKLDGIYVIRPNVPAASVPAAEVVRSYKQLSGVEWAFRSLKTVDLRLRPIHHWLAQRVRAHVLLCMLAYYVEFHVRGKLAALLFDDHDKAAAQARRDSIVKPAQRSQAAERKALTKQTTEGGPVHSFHSPFSRPSHAHHQPGSTC
jgi:transposase